MSDVTVERREEDSQQVSIRSATTADFDTILALFNEGLGGSEEETDLIRTNLTQTETDAKDGKQLLSFISYVGDKPAGCVLVTRLSEEALRERTEARLRPLEDIFSASAIETWRRKEEMNYPYQAIVPAFVIAEEFQNKPEVLFAMARHLLGMRENDRAFNFIAKLREDTMYRIVKSKLLQRRIGDLGYSVRELPSNDATGHYVELEPLTVPPVEAGRGPLKWVKNRLDGFRNRGQHPR